MSKIRTRERDRLQNLLPVLNKFKIWKSSENGRCSHEFRGNRSYKVASIRLILEAEVKSNSPYIRSGGAEAYLETSQACIMGVFFAKIFNGYPVVIYMFKVNNRNSRTRCEICSKLTIKTPERRHVVPQKVLWRPCIVLVSLLLTLNIKAKSFITDVWQNPKSFSVRLFMKKRAWYFLWFFHDEDPYHIETSLLICRAKHIETSLLTCRAKQWTDFYMIGTFVMKE